MMKLGTNPELRRWGALVAGLWMLSCGGLSYNFAIYSSQLKESLGYNQEQIDMLGTAKDIGDNVGLLAGLLSTMLPPYVLLLIGAVQNLVGYVAIFLISSKQVPEPSFWAVFLFMWMGVNGSTFFNTAALVTCVRFFPHSRGVVVGLLKAMVGLSGAIFTQLYLAAMAPNQLAFLLLVALGPTLVSLLVIPVLRPASKATDSPPAVRPPEEEAEESANLFFLLGIFLFLALYLMAEILLSSFMPISRAWSQAITAGMLSIVALTLLVPVRVYFRTRGQLDAAGSSAIEQPLLQEQSAASAAMAATPTSSLGRYVRPRRGENFTLLEGFLKADFWLMFVSILCAAGSGLTAIDNLAQMGEAQGIDDMKVPVALVSLWNYMGRIVGGFYSEHLVRNLGLPRPCVLLAAHALMLIGHLLFAFAVPGSIYVGSLVVGSSFGTTMAIVPAVASEIFGLRNFGLFYNTFTSALPIGSYLFSSLLAGYIYDIESQTPIGSFPLSSSAPTPGPSPGPEVCRGAHCFRLTFELMALVCLVAVICDVVLVVRTGDVYRRLYPRHSRLTVGNSLDISGGEGHSVKEERIVVAP